jgi:hypothetical protein
MKNLIKKIILTGALGLASLINSGCSTLDADRTFEGNCKFGCTTIEYKQIITNNPDHTAFGTACYCDHDNNGPVAGTIKRFGGKLKEYSCR